MAFGKKVFLLALSLMSSWALILCINQCPHLACPLTPKQSLNDGSNKHQEYIHTGERE